MNIADRLADHLRTLRRRAGLTLDQLADQSGVSRATLSRIEKAEVSPTAEVLGRLCAAYRLPMSRLLMEVESGFAAHVPLEKQTEWRDPETGLTRRQVSPPSPSLSGEVLECHLPPGRSIAYPAPPRLGLEHHLVMLDGALTLTVEDAAHDLTAGDCLRYRLYGASRFETPPERGAHYLLVLI